MRPVAPTDLMFLLAERRNQPMHVGALALLKLPPGAGAHYVRGMAAQVRSHKEVFAPFNRRLVRRMGVWFWETDDNFDIEAHFHHAALPKPGRIRELFSLVSSLHSGLMDRAKPLWELHLIEGVEGNRAALFIKIHHAFADGVAFARMLPQIMSEDSARGAVPLWARPPEAVKPPEAKVQQPGNLLTPIMSVVSQQLSTWPNVVRALAQAVRDTGTQPGHVSVFQAPESLLNREISASRRFAAQSWPLDRIKAVAKEHSVTLNDVVLAMCSSALRQYLTEHNAIPAKPLVSMVPVSLRGEDSPRAGNLTGLVLANLATDQADPLARLETIAKSMRHAKQRLAGLSPLEVMQYVSATMALSGINIATGLMPEKQSFNLVISNVPGPKNPLFFEGAAVEGMYPVSIVCDGLALNITVGSYAGKLEFGLIACSRTLPQMQRLLDYLEDGLIELEAERVAAPAASAGLFELRSM
jgi:diacylglycerol O-acyltransferase / wax synthase